MASLISMACSEASYTAEFAIPHSSGKIDGLLAGLDSLRKADYVSIFREVAQRIVNFAGGQLPSPDRLKRLPFTQDLVQHLKSPAR